MIDPLLFLILLLVFDIFLYYLLFKCNVTVESVRGWISDCKGDDDGNCYYNLNIYYYAFYESFIYLYNLILTNISNINSMNNDIPNIMTIAAITFVFED